MGRGGSDKVHGESKMETGPYGLMTAGEAEKLLSAKRYLKSRYPAIIGTKIPGRPKRMHVQEGMKMEVLDLIDLLSREFSRTIIRVTDNPLAAQRAGWILHLDSGRPVNDFIPETRVSAAS
jgi:hypothetical protein